MTLMNPVIEILDCHEGMYTNIIYSAVQSNKAQHLVHDLNVFFKKERKEKQIIFYSTYKIQMGGGAHHHPSAQHRVYVKLKHTSALVEVKVVKSTKIQGGFIASARAPAGPHTLLLSTI